MSEFRTTTQLRTNRVRCSVDIVSCREGSHLALEGEACAWETAGGPWFRVIFPGRKQLRDFANAILDHLDRTEDIVRKRKRRAVP